MRINQYLQPKTLQEAYDLLNMDQSNQILGGGCWLKLLPKEIHTAIDLSCCGLDEISEDNNYIRIGSQAVLRKLETHPLIKGILRGIVSNSISEVMGVPFRNIATLGGTVAGRYGFSDILTALLALNTELEWYKGGRMSLKDYLGDKKNIRDILTAILIPKQEGRSYYYTLKKTANDFPVVNIALVMGGDLTIAVGARPGVALLAEKTMAYLNSSAASEIFTDPILSYAQELLIKECSFGTNTRGSREYREEVIKGLLLRGLKEVYQ